MSLRCNWLLDCEVSSFVPLFRFFYPLFKENIHCNPAIVAVIEKSEGQLNI